MNPSGFYVDPLKFMLNLWIPQVFTLTPKLP